jgi:hypothetical protein
MIPLLVEQVFFLELKLVILVQKLELLHDIESILATQ